MKTKDKIISLIAIFGIFCWLIFLIKSVLAPFICSLVIAYFLDPLVNLLNKKLKLSRGVATSLILGLFLIVLIAFISLLAPIIYNQFLSLIGALPEYFQIITNDFYPKVLRLLNRFGFKLEKDFSHLVIDNQFGARFSDLSQNIFENVITSSAALINVLSVIFITPILIFYLLKDWDILTKKINSLLPRAISSSVKKIAFEIDKTLSGYIRGQFNVCLILALVYSSLLSLSGLNFGFLIGFMTGVFAFIPFGGMLCGVVAATIFGLLQWGFDFNHAIAITAVFVFGQILESNFLTPKLIGSKVGLHPVWIIFGLFAFGALFGFVGILIAVPLTAVFGVVIRHFANEYKKKFT